MADDPGGVLLEHYRDQLAEERSTKQATERRGQAVIATNGAIATLLFAFGDITVDLTTRPGQVVVVLLSGAMLLLAVSAGCGLLANRPQRYGVTNVEKLIALAANDAVWTAPLTAAQKNVATDIAKIVKIAERRNNTKGKRLRWAVDTQVTGLAFLAATLLFNVFVPPPSQEKPPVAEQSEQPTSTEGQPATPDSPTQGDGAALPAEPWFGEPQESIRALVGDRVERPTPRYETKTAEDK